MPTLPRSALYFAWELNHHNVYLANPALLTAMLRAVSECGGSANFREEFSKHLIATGLPGNVRSDSNRSDLWRDYQQLLKEWSLVSDHESGFRLSALGELALDGAQQSALGLAVFRFQYPNPYKRRYPKWSRLSPPGPRGDPDWSEYLSVNGVCVRPALLVARLLMAADRKRRVSQLSKDDIRDRLFRVTTEPNSDEELLDLYFETPLTDWAQHTKRNAEEWMRSLVATGLFAYTSGSAGITIVESRRDSLAELINIISSEPHWTPSESSNARSDATAADWFQHSQGLCLPMSDPVIRTLPRAVATSSASPAASEILTRPYARRARYQATDTGSSPGFDSAAAIARQRAADQLHQDVVDALANHLRVRGLTPEEDPNSVDMLVCRGEVVEIFEVKTVERTSWSDRLRLAVGQLLEYQSRLFQSRGVLPQTTLVLSRPIPFESWQRDHFRRLGITVIAFQAGTFVTVV
jgi:hypothetical protein